MSKRKVRLAPLAEIHLERNLGWMANPRIMEPFAYSGVTDAETQRKWFDGLQVDPSQEVFAVLDEELGYVGNLGFKDIEPRHRLAQMWIFVGREEAHGQGIGTLATIAGAGLGFRKFHLDKIYLNVRADNQAALRMYRKAGFAKEGFLRSEWLFRGRRLDIVRMGILREDWEGRQ